MPAQKEKVARGVRKCLNVRHGLMDATPSSHKNSALSYEDLCDPQFFAKLYDTHAKRIYRYAVLRLSSAEDAEDILATTFLKLWEYGNKKRREANKSPDNAEISNISALIYRIARNLIIDRYRSRAPVLSLEYLAEKGFEPADHGGGSELYAEHSAVLYAISQLPSDDRDLVALRYVEGITVKEIAEIFEITENNASVRLHRAMGKLKEVVNGK